MNENWVKQVCKKKIKSISKHRQVNVLGHESFLTGIKVKNIES